MSHYLAKFVEKKIALAASLNEGALDANYGDAILIMSSVISTLARELWPGRSNDKVRFVELCRRYGPEHLHPTVISAPLFTSQLRDQGRESEARAIEGNAIWPSPGYSALVIKGTKIDKDENDLLSVCPSLAKIELRKYSYASLFYEHVRSAYVHEYESSPHASAHRQAEDGLFVSYVNMVQKPYRRIHFPFVWVVALARGICETMPDGPQEEPSEWWLNSSM